MPTTDNTYLPRSPLFAKPWEIPPAPRAPKGNTLDDGMDLPDDPCAGWEVGPCEIIRRLSPGSVKVLLAKRHDAREGATLVVMRRIDVAEHLAPEIESHAEWAWKFKHPHLSRVFPSEASDEGIFWVSERASGATIAELSEACRKLGKGLPVGLVLGAIFETAQALGELHVPSGFSHGLISDQAIAVSFDGTARLQDVGMFKCLSRTNTWAEVLETVGPYLSPEQLLQGRPPDTKCDVFSLGAVLWEGLTGQRLPRAASFDDRLKKQANATYAPPSTYNVSLSKELDAVVLRALSPNRAERYFDALELADALRKASAPFMWRRELRADFVGNLFPSRKRHEEALLAQCAPKRSLTRPELQMPVIAPPALPPLKVVAPVAKPKAVVVAAKAPVKKKRPAPKHIRALSLGFIAATLGWAAFGGVLPADDLAQIWAEPAPGYVIDLPPPPPPPAPVVAPVAAAEPLVCEAPAVVAEAPEAPVAKPAVKRAFKPKRKKSEDVPDAPWLASPKRGRR